MSEWKTLRFDAWDRVKLTGSEHAYVFRDCQIEVSWCEGEAITWALVSTDTALEAFLDRRMIFDITICTADDYGVHIAAGRPYASVRRDGCMTLRGTARELTAISPASREWFTEAPETPARLIAAVRAAGEGLAEFAAAWASNVGEGMKVVEALQRFDEALENLQNSLDITTPAR